MRDVVTVTITRHTGSDSHQYRATYLGHDVCHQRKRHISSALRKLAWHEGGRRLLAITFVDTSRGEWEDHF